MTAEPYTAHGLLDLLHAVREALDIPYAATVGGDRTRQAVLMRRVMHAAIALEQVLSDQPGDLEYETRALRRRLTDHPPVGYVTTDQAHEAAPEGEA